jgi:hypothetical protein
VKLRQALIAIPLAASIAWLPSPSPSADYAGTQDRWWGPGETRAWPQRLDYANSQGLVGVLRDGPALETRGHAFFTSLGPNGRACVTCHQPADGMSLSAATARERWAVTSGRDPLFAAIDGSNCPNLPQAKPSPRTRCCWNRGLIRVSLPWPPRGEDGKPLDPEFTLEVVRDPTGCNTGAVHGLKSPNRRFPCTGARGPWPTPSTPRTRISACCRSSARTACPPRAIRTTASPRR